MEAKKAGFMVVLPLLSSHLTNRNIRSLLVLPPQFGSMQVAYHKDIESVF